MFVINPDQYSLPSFRLGTFRTSDVSNNHQLPDDHSIDNYFKSRFDSRNYCYTINGRSAINRALSQLKLNRDDVVTIFTTTGNFYVSGCVTEEIEKYCRWSRSIKPKSKAIFVIHEFGYPYEDLAKLKEYNLPIIEDCAYSFFSVDKHSTIGTIGDYVIYSFPKIFPIQIGGLLVLKRNTKPDPLESIDTARLNYIKKVLSFYINKKDDIIHRRINNYERIRELLTVQGFPERFPLGDGIVPGVFMFRKNEWNINLPELKEYMWVHGIQCSVFYGEESFFIPTHQYLNETELEYFSEVIRSFVEK
ncbi:DegT/DnrJ/EryC1/StrS family aminotransferase [bacterium]|nr:DegT/DnrJ/EryC1/StrS family aminotransferase [bacterium]